MPLLSIRVAKDANGEPIRVGYRVAASMQDRDGRDHFFSAMVQDIYAGTDDAVWLDLVNSRTLERVQARASDCARQRTSTTRKVG